MNKNFEIQGDKVIVRDENGFRTTRELTYNIKKILICENNIEVMEKMINDEENNIKSAKEEIKIKNLYIITATLWLIPFILNSVSGNWFAAVMNIICSSMYGSRVLLAYLDKNKTIKLCNRIIADLNEKIEIEKEKLNELKEDNHNNFNSLSIKPSDKNLSTTELITDLKHKLYFIRNYHNNKQKYIRWYKKGILSTELSWYSDDEIRFIEELIKQEYPDLEVIKNIEENQKILTK